MSLQTHQIQRQPLKDLGNLTELQSPQLVTSTPVQQQTDTIIFTLPHHPVPILTPLSRSYDYLTTPFRKESCCSSPILTPDKF